MNRDELPSLLLLPFPPDPASRQALSAAYRPPLSAAIAKLRNSTRHARLIIAVACPILQGGQYARRKKTLPWREAQSLIAGIYTLVAIICAQQGIATEADGGPGSVESIVVLVDHDRKRRLFPNQQQEQQPKPAIETNNTAVIDLPCFAAAYFPWNYIFHVRTEMGIQLNRDYLAFAETKQTLLQEQLVPVEGGLTIYTAQPGLPSPATTATTTVPARRTICLGGTFDHLHPGHKLLLTAGALLLQVPEPGSGAAPCQYVIGVTGDELLKKKKYAEQVQPWDDRARAVLSFLTTLLHLSPRGWGSTPSSSPGSISKESPGPPQPLIDETRDSDFRALFREGTIAVQCVRIQDAFGPTVTVEDMDALVVSGETRAGGQAVNDRRREQGWRALEVFEVDVLDAEEIPDAEGDGDRATKAENFAAKISSTAIRKQRAELQNQGGGF